jgi:hypothetical protein
MRIEICLASSRLRYAKMVLKIQYSYSQLEGCTKDNNLSGLFRSLVQHQWHIWVCLASRFCTMFEFFVAVIVFPAALYFI